RKYRPDARGIPGAVARIRKDAVCSSVPKLRYRMAFLAPTQSLRVRPAQNEARRFHGHSSTPGDPAGRGRGVHRFVALLTGRMAESNGHVQTTEQYPSKPGGAKKERRYSNDDCTNNRLASLGAGGGRSARQTRLSSPGRGATNAGLFGARLSRGGGSRPGWHSNCSDNYG